MHIEGLWLPLITPFRDGELDEPSLRLLIGIISDSRSTG